jgi:hypothetical protein
MTATLGVETEALVRHAHGRYSDGFTCDGIRYYVQRMGAVPPSAWGTMPWSAPEFGDQSHDTKTPPPSVNPAWRTGRWQPGAGSVPGTA